VNCWNVAGLPDGAYIFKPKITNLDEFLERLAMKGVGQF
jgi:hypothetical protein